MATSKINITLGTAGHIDHGKTALIKLLTGCDTDFLKEEKERGMSIELGFAPCTIADLEVGIVDVPGHEHFIKTMVAGATGIDGVIFVIAADDGVMPQTREHLDILTLLGVAHGIVALTKVDAVSPERVAAVTDEVRRFLTGTFLADAPILPMSSITGQGFDGFYEGLRDLVAQIRPRTVEGVFRLPIEKTFSVKGYGSVVTGIPVSGCAAVGDEVVLLPQGQKGRIKAIQVYSSPAEQVLSGQCAALSVPQWDYRSIVRGNVVTVGRYFAPRQWYLCKLQMLPQDKLFLKTGTQVKFHTGASEVVAKVYLMEGNTITAGREQVVQIHTERPVVAAPGDRFIIRTPSPANTIGGGLIVEAMDQRIRRSRPDLLDEARARAEAVSGELSFLEYCVKTAEGGAANPQQLSLRAKILPPRLDMLLTQLQQAGTITRLSGNLFVHVSAAEQLENKLTDAVRQFHNTQPESPGIAPDALLHASGLNKNVFDGLLERMLAAGTLTQRKGCIALPEHREDFDPAQRRLLASVEDLFAKRLFNPPSIDEAAAAIGVPVGAVQKTVRILTEQQTLVQIDRDNVFHSKAIREASRRLTEHIQKEGKLESVAFKYLLDTTRKWAIPLLDYMDKIGVTMRSGNTRYLKKPLA
ncbi:MAG: selenocysteine-specific translation elongation factor [Phycisphaerae bacterium]|nr:selenocysteine-specific translation elongation factor [Phycisphaerae bacterium]